MNAVIANLVDEARAASLAAKAAHDARTLDLGVALIRYLEGCAEASVLPAQAVADVVAADILAVRAADLVDDPGAASSPLPF